MMRAGMFKGKLRRSRQAAPAGTGPQRAPGSLIAGPECRLDGAMARAAARRDGERPYAAPPATGPDTAAFRRLGATFTPHPAPVTAPMAVVPTEVPAVAEPPAVTGLRKLAGGLRNLDWKTLDEARGKGTTYAAASQARGRLPFHDAVRAAVRVPDGTPGLAPAAARHITSLAYPACDGSATFRDYAALMRRVDGLTGTRGTNLWPLPALPAGGAR